MPGSYKPSETVDFVVVGSGAAGGIVAKELAVAGFSVVVLEQGPYLKAKDFQHDEMSIIYLLKMVNNEPITFRKSAGEKVTVRKAVDYCRTVGGGSVHFTANYWRFHENDFQEHSKWGSVAGADVQNWPISYADLEPYYTKAEYDLGISGQAGVSPFDPPRSKPYPLPPLPVKSSGALFERGAKKMGLHPFPAPMAILSQPYKGRSACQHCGFCYCFGCEYNAKSSTLAATIPVAEKTGKCEIRSESYVRKVETNAAGRVTGVIYFDRDKKEVRQKARAVVLCANGAETPRLLLMSKSTRFPNGLANSSGHVGTGLMFDTGTVAFGAFENPLNEHKSVMVTRILHDYYETDPKRGFWGGFGLDARSLAYPIGFAMDGLPPDVPRWGNGYKHALEHYFTRTMMTLSHTSSLAQQKNTIALDPEVKDQWGLPAMQVTWEPHPDDVKAMQYSQDRMKEILDTAGAKKVWAPPVSGIEDVLPSRHLMGTCRMGKDPKSSVVDANNRAHDVPNLFIVDGSSLVTSGRQQPTATIQALAYRTADHLLKLAKSGQL